MPAFVVNLGFHSIVGVGLFAQMDQDITGLTAGGVAMMTLSIGLVTALAAFCIHRILRADNPTESRHPPLDSDT